MSRKKKPVRLWLPVSHKLVTQPCKCGCGKIPSGTRRDAGRKREFFNATCRKRWNRAQQPLKSAKLKRDRRRQVAG